MKKDLTSIMDLTIETNDSLFHYRRDPQGLFISIDTSSDTGNPVSEWMYECCHECGNTLVEIPISERRPLLSETKIKILDEFGYEFIKCFDTEGEDYEIFPYQFYMLWRRKDSP